MTYRIRLCYDIKVLSSSCTANDTCLTTTGVDQRALVDLDVAGEDDSDDDTMAFAEDDKDDDEDMAQRP